MKHSSHVFLIILILAVLIGGSFLTASIPASAALQISGVPLNAAGKAFEVNADNNDLLWITDYDAIPGEVWSVNALISEYRIYYVGGNPSDARRVGEYFYWADGESSTLGRANLQGASLEAASMKWSVPSVAGYYGTTVDSAENLWVTDAIDPNIYHLDPASNNVCTYTIPETGLLGYLVYHGGYIWFGYEYVDSEIKTHALLERLRISDHRLEWWELPEGSSPFGMTVDLEGDLWFANPGTSIHLSELDPETDTLKSYRLPIGLVPAMITIHDGLVWYTEQHLETIGMLDPALAQSTSDVLTISGSTTLEPVCKVRSPVSGTVPYSDGTFSDDSASLPVIKEADGWHIYQMPIEANPWGIAFQADKIWVVDNGRQLLVQAPLQASVRACKKFDFDKNLDTKTDQVPLSGWGMTLYKGEVEQETQFTGSDGCVRWDGKELGVSYKVVEETRSLWEALSPVECNLGIAEKPGTYTCDFYNWTQNFLFLPLVMR